MRGEGRLLLGADSEGKPGDLLTDGAVHLTGFADGGPGIRGSDPGGPGG
ncbi:hypothetical protein ACGFW5_01935 [Streptomyces sp. NPDC048416]